MKDDGVLVKPSPNAYIIGIGNNKRPAKTLTFLQSFWWDSLKAIDVKVTCAEGSKDICHIFGAHAFR